MLLKATQYIPYRSPW